MSEIEKSMKQTIDRIWSEGRNAGLSDFDIIQMIETVIQEKLRAERTRPKKRSNYTPMTDEEIEAARRNISEPPTPSKEPEYEIVDRKKRTNEPEYEVVERIPQPQPELYAPPLYRTETVEIKKSPRGEIIEKKVRMVPSEEVLYAPPQVVTEYSVKMPELLYAPPTLELYEMLEDEPVENGDDQKGNGGSSKK